MPESTAALTTRGAPAAWAAADDWAEALQAEGRCVVRTLGLGLPLAWLRACGLTAVALAPLRPQQGSARPPASADRRPEALQVEALAAARAWPLIIRTDDPAGYAVFSIVRERLRTGSLPPRPVFGLDLPGGCGVAGAHGAVLATYHRQQLHKLAAWAATVGGRQPDEPALHEAVARERTRQERLDRWPGLRAGAAPRLGGQVAAAALLAAQVMPAEHHAQALDALRDSLADSPPIAGPRCFVAGLRPATIDALAHLDRLGAVVGDDLAAGTPAIAAADHAADALRSPFLERPSDPRERARLTVRLAQAAGADRVVHLSPPGDECEPWFRPWLRDECRQAGLEWVPFESLTAAPDTPASSPWASSPAVPSSAAAPGAAPREARSRKSLAAVAEFSRYQRDWFQGVRERAAAGEPFAVINADAPQELLRAFDLPFVVNQWWGSIVAAKQQASRHLALLAERGYPTSAEPYSAQGLAALFDHDRDQAPWGGLPTPRLLMAVKGTPATAGIFAAWAAHSGAELLLFDRSAETRLAPPTDWWDRLPGDWDRCLDADRLDLLQSQFAHAIGRIEALSGRRFDEARFAEVMDLVNRQEHHYRQARDLIAHAPRAPVGVVDTMPAVMVPQWHRGTAWGVDAARTLHDEVRRRIDAGQAACEGERLRLMWVGRGLWSHMSFYQRWEDSHGAVFVWSMYLGLAADGYLRHCAPGQSLLRALASRFVTMGDELRMPTWAGAWHVKEARLHRVDAAVAVDDADPLVLQALEAAGVPVLRLDLSNFGVLDDALEAAAGRVGRFLDTIGTSKAER